MQSKLPSYHLPSSKKSSVIFRKPLVSDAIEFCARLPERDEKVATEYLNTLLVESKNVSSNSIDWTVEDRMAALVWIYVNIHDDTRLDFKYKCKHCNEMHVGEIELMDLDSEMTQLDKLVLPKFDIKLGGRKHVVTLDALRGKGAEALQLLASDMDELSDGEKARRRTELKIEELMHRLSFNDEPDDIEEALKYRFDLLLSIDTQEMLRLSMLVNEHKPKLRHGYHSQQVDGIQYLISLPIQCDTKTEDKNAHSRLMFPAKCGYFIPSL